MTAALIRAADHAADRAAASAPDRAGHARGARCHARRRAWERLRLCLSDGDIRHLAACCRQQPLVARQDYRQRAIHRLIYRGRTLWLVYDDALAAVVTILASPPPWLRRLQRREHRR